MGWWQVLFPRLGIIWRLTPIVCILPVLNLLNECYRVALDQETDWFTWLNQYPPNEKSKSVRWLELLIQVPNLITDVLVILDCRPLEIERMEILDFRNDTLRFQVMIPGYENSPSGVGMFTSYLAELLVSASDLVNRKMRKEFITTDWLIGQLLDTNLLPHLALEPYLLCNTVEDDHFQILSWSQWPYLSLNEAHTWNYQDMIMSNSSTLSH
jgi:hypothetical protein